MIRERGSEIIYSCTNKDVNKVERNYISLSVKK